MQVVPGIEYVDETSPAHVYVLDDGGALTLIDAGLPNEAPKVLAYLARTGRAPAQVQRIVLTHRHGDHAGAVPDLVAATRAAVYAHADEAEALGQQESMPRDIRRLGDGDVLPVFEGLRAIAVPGHTSGHLCFYLPARQVLFTGDALLNRGGLTGPVPQYTADLAQAHAALRRQIGPLAVETLCVAHGEVIRAGAGPHLRQALTELA